MQTSCSVIRSKQENWGIIAFTETHWKKGTKGRNITGYSAVHIERSSFGKKGGGIAIWIKETIPFTIWSSEIESEGEVINEAELLWVVIETMNGQMAVGITYIGVNTPENSARNETLHQKIVNDHRELSKAGIKVLLIGDFNGHITPATKLSLGKYDKNGKRLENTRKQCKMSIMNFTSKCHGKWTWIGRVRRQ